MSRNNSIPTNPDSDQSISDEDEDEDIGWPDNFVSFAETSDRKKKGMGVASQLELFEGVHQNVGFLSDDEVEAPDFDEKRHLDSTSRDVSHAIDLERDASKCDIDEEFSGDEGSQTLFKSVIAGCTVSETLDRYARNKQKQVEPCTWSAADTDGRRPVNKHSTMGGRPTMRTKWSSHCQEHKKRTLWSSIQKSKDHNHSSEDELQDEPETIDFQPLDKSIYELPGHSDFLKISESKVTSLVEVDVQHEWSRHSMVELLDELGGSRRNPHFKSRMGGRRKGRMGQHAVLKNVSSGKDLMSDEEPFEVMDSGSSTDNEDKFKNPELAIVESKRRTMADKFLEAFGSSLDDRRPSFAVANKPSNGIFGKLQQVLQRQKERDIEFFKNLQTDIWPKGEARCLDVKIMSRSYDAKLIVCQCSLLENEESSLENPQCTNFRKIWTIIFSQRVCGDVDLEVSNLFRIHPPWKEVQVQQGGDIIILATYYSQINT